MSRPEEAATAAKRLLDSRLPGMRWADARTGARAFLILADSARRQGEKEAAQRWFWKAFRLAPLMVLRNGIRPALKALLGPTVSSVIRRAIRRFRSV